VVAPGYSNAANTDYRLDSTSDLIDSGVTTILWVVRPTSELLNMGYMYIFPPSSKAYKSEILKYRGLFGITGNYLVSSRQGIQGTRSPRISFKLYTIEENTCATIGLVG
jgi:hypothetical protein